LHGFLVCSGLNSLVKAVAEVSVIYFPFLSQVESGKVIEMLAGVLKPLQWKLEMWIGKRQWRWRGLSELGATEVSSL
jgi:hypothetical protein